MPELQLSRRRALGGLAAVGVTSTGVGWGTTALFSDSEEFTNNTATAGQLDIKTAWKKTVVGREATVETSDGFPTPDNDVTAPICELEDLKPGDHGHIEFVLRVDDNPGYLSLLAAEQADGENGQPEPERSALTESIPVGREGELDELTATTVSYADDGTTPAYTTSLASLIDMARVGTGVPLDGAGSASVVDIVIGDATPAPFAPGVEHGLRVDFQLPAAVGNGVQSDRYRFAIGIYGEQTRHNEP